MRGALIAFLLTGACTQRARIEFVPPPPLPATAKSMLVAYAGDEYYALALDADRSIEMPLDQGMRTLVMEASVFSQSLAEFGLSDGVVMPATETSAALLPAGLGDYTLAINDGVAAKAWVETSRGPRLSTFRVRGVSHCDKFKLQTFALETPEPAVALLPLDPNSLLLVTAINGETGQEAEFYELRSDGPHKLPISMPGFAPGSATEASDGTIYLGGGDQVLPNEIWSGGRDGFTPLPETPEGTYLRAMAFSRTSSGDVALYVEGDRGSLERLGPGGWQTIHGLTLAADAERAGLAWSGQGDEMFGLGAFTNTPPFLTAELRHVERGRLSSFSFPNQVLTAIALIPGIGILVGSINGEVFRADASGKLTSLGSSGRLLRNSAFAPYKDGFLFSGSEGAIDQWRALEGFCPEAQPSSLNEVTLIAPLKDQLILAGSGPHFSQNFVVLLTSEP